jgi:hypothetical protein
MAPKKKETPATGQLLISVAEFRKTRDSVRTTTCFVLSAMATRLPSVTASRWHHAQHGATFTSPRLFFCVTLIA